MGRSGTLALIAALGFFIAFFTNIALGAFGDGVVLDDVPEMLTMFAAALLFTVGVLQREVAENEKRKGRMHDDRNPDR